MTKPYAPDMDTQVGLMKLRKNAERHDIERRSRMAESVDIGHRVIDEIRAMTTPENKEFANAKETIVRLVRQSAVFSRVIQKLVAESGGAIDRSKVDKLVEQITREVEGDQEFHSQVPAWADRQIGGGPTIERPTIRWK